MAEDETVAGFHRYKVGDIEITAVSDGARHFAMPDGFILNATRDEVNAALADAAMPKDRMTTIYTPIVINTASWNVLIDTGNGPDIASQPDTTYGHFQSNLKAAGIDSSLIDVVVISHFHADHVNGLWAADGTLAFPNAAIAVPANEWKFWMDDGEMARAPKGRMESLFNNNRRVFDPIKDTVIQYSWDREVAPGIKVVGTPGHSIGHTSFLVSSDSQSVFVQSDVTNHPALFARHPGWHASFDQDPVQAETTRRKIYEMLVSEKMPVQGFHFPFLSPARVEREGDGYRVTPADI